MIKSNVFALFSVLISTSALGQAANVAAAAAERPRPAWATGPTYSPPAVQTGVASLVRAYPAPEAGQGVAVDAKHFYAVVNFVIAKYNKDSGLLVSRWIGLRSGLIRHLNSCFESEGDLLCANSNFPEIPMGSSIEVFDAGTMQHKSSKSLGMLEEGSLTFFDRLSNGWIAGFAHYDADGGIPYKNSNFASIATYDAEWRRTGGWMLPKSVMERMAPHAASGGAIGPDGLLYLMGHDRTELYVLAKPTMGPALMHLATFEIAAEGQAFSWDRAEPRRLYAISRKSRTVRVFDVPTVTFMPNEGSVFR
jgi:hypothetical protein